MAEFTEDDDCFLFVQRMAAHHAAHALVASLHGYHVARIVLDDVTCICDASSGDRGGNSVEHHVWAARACERQCLILLAGALAEAMFSPLPPESALARRDREQARALLSELCGPDAECVEKTLLSQVRAMLNRHSWSIAVLSQQLLKTGVAYQSDIEQGVSLIELSRLGVNA